MRQQKLLVKIHSAAFYFSHISRDVNEIASKMPSVSRGMLIYKWAKTAEWEHALDVFGYTGDREFARRPRRDTKRDAGDVFLRARAAYFKAINAGVPTNKLATVAGDAVGYHAGVFMRGRSNTAGVKKSIPIVRWRSTRRKSMKGTRPLNND